MTDVLIRRGHLDTHTHTHTRGQSVRVANVNHREKTAIYKPRGQAWNRSFSHSLQKVSTLLDLRLLASRL